MRLRRAVTFATALTAVISLGAAANAATPHQVRQVTLRAYAAAAADKHPDIGCRQAIGVGAAKAVVRYCRYVSSATHPPCNTINHCALIVEDIQRNCQQDAKAPCQAQFSGRDWREMGKLTAH